MPAGDEGMAGGAPVEPVAPGSSGGGGVEGRKEKPPQSEFSRYLSRLRSESVQGWAKESTKTMSRGWKGDGAGSGGWGVGTGSEGGEGKGGRGGAGGRDGGRGGGAGYLDPRVRMVVTSYPPTGIERRYTAVPYPELKLKRHQYTSGWWNVYIKVQTDNEGKVLHSSVLRPETDGAIEKMFIKQVQLEMTRWEFDPVPAEIHVDVRFYVE